MDNYNLISTQWHEYFLAARAGDLYKRRILERWSRILEFKREKEDWERIYQKEMVQPPSSL